MYNEFAQEHTTLDSNEMEEVDNTSISVNAFPWVPPRRNKTSNVVSPLDGKLSAECMGTIFRNKDIATILNVRLITGAFCQQLPMDQKPGILRNNKP